MGDNAYAPGAMAPAVTDPTRAEVDESVEVFGKDQKTIEDSQQNCVDAYNRVQTENRDKHWWDQVYDFFARTFQELWNKIQEYVELVKDLFEEISKFDAGDPMAIFEAGSAYLDAQKIFSGQLGMLTDWNLPAKASWEGEAGRAYRAGVEAQRSAIDRLAQWCGSIGSELRQHARNVVAAYLTMMMDFAKKVLEIQKLLNGLITADLSKVLDIVKNIAELIPSLMVMVQDVATAFKLWANQSIIAIDRIENATANQSGTAAGQWPSFVRS